jgi:predicted metal-dependent hydrolase
MQNKDIKLVRSKRRSLALEITPNATLIIRAPMQLSINRIEEFVNTKKDWIRKKQREILEKHQIMPKKYEDGEGFLYLGKKYKLEIVDWQNQPLFFNQGFKLSRGHVKNAQKIIGSWYKEEAKRLIGEQLLYYSSISGLKYKGVKISNASKRWGSCSGKGNLNFSWRLIMAPLSVFDYVIVHELVHIQEHNHSKRFWKKVEEIMPDYKMSRKWLKGNGHSLSI